MSSGANLWDSSFLRNPLPFSAREKSSRSGVRGDEDRVFAAAIVLWGIWLVGRVRVEGQVGQREWVFENAWNGVPQRVRVP